MHTTYVHSTCDARVHTYEKHLVAHVHTYEEKH